MKCPKCAAEMLIKSIDEIEIDLCSGCGGIFLDDGEFQSFTGMDPHTGAVKLAKFAKVLAKLNERAVIDELTGVYSRKYFNEYMHGVFSNPKRGRVTLIAVDIDHFKSVNTEFGHAGGDAALRTVAQRLKTSMRSSRDDGVFRVGGEEFCLVLLELNAEDSFNAAENLRKLVMLEPVHMPDGRTKQITISAGVALARESDTAETLYARGDELLYRAKDAGRNRVVIE
jgi:diguanylate cyclase (GGDEF)-like protein